MSFCEVQVSQTCAKVVIIWQKTEKSRLAGLRVGTLSGLMMRLRAWGGYLMTTLSVCTVPSERVRRTMLMPFCGVENLEPERV